MSQAARNRITRSRPVQPAPRQEILARTTVFEINRADSDTSRQLTFFEDFAGLLNAYGATVALATPYPVERLFQLVEMSNILRPCIDAMVTNTVGTGWEVGETLRGMKFNEGEALELLSFIENANSEESLSAVMSKVVRDRESAGFAFLEAIRDASDRISALRHAPAIFTRLCTTHPDEQLVTTTIRRGRRVSVLYEYRKFRRFVQIVAGAQVWFKEFGDKRRMDSTNGAFEGEPGFTTKALATEIIHFRLPSNDAYGTPRWINQLPSILGSREAEEVNMRYFQDNTVPPLMLLVGGGRLTEASYKEISKALDVKKGRDRQHKVMLLEAVGEGDSLDSRGSPVDLKVEKLSDTRQSDGLFKDYDSANMAKVRSSFRLPPITVGMSQDVNFATASTSAFVAESQVFSPARDEIDERLNKLLVNGPLGLDLATCKLVSRTPSITSPEMVLKTLTALNVIGAVTPRSAQLIGNKVLQTELDAYPQKGEEGYAEWMDTPLPVSNLNARKAQADATAKNHEDQALKDDKIKGTEEDGDIAPDVPKHGEE